MMWKRSYRSLSKLVMQRSSFALFIAETVSLISVTVNQIQVRREKIATEINEVVSVANIKSCDFAIARYDLRSLVKGASKQ